MAIPTLEAVKALDSKDFAMLTPDEHAVFCFYRDQGRKFDVAVEVRSNADPKELGRASRDQADEIMRRAWSHVRITIGKDAQEAWASRVRFDESEKLVTTGLPRFIQSGMQAGRKSY